jgi:hypothetical protein
MNLTLCALRLAIFARLASEIFLSRPQPTFLTSWLLTQNGLNRLNELNYFLIGLSAGLVV